MAEATKPIIDRISDSVPSASDVTGAAKGFSEGVTQSIISAREGFSSGLEDFSKSADISDASSDFLSANGLLAKFVFLILVLIAFMILMKVGIAVLGYMLGPWSNPYLIKGSLGGSTTATITQDPRDDDSAIIMRSNDRNKGIEFTWSLWLFLDKDSNGGIKNIFVKGDEQFSGDYNLLNGPGLYLDSTGNTFNLQVRMDTVNSHVDSVIKDVPIQKWFHVAIRMQNKVMDTYINGVVTDRFNLPSLPKQNFNNVTVHANGGYSGSTSNLRYYSYALNVFEINNIIMFGPNLNPSSLSADSKALSGNYSFLAHSWYGSNYST
jgi:hypothetical protein